jgi:hypothetical protein
MNKTSVFAALFAAVALVGASPATLAADAGRAFVAGQKIDSGLGDLPHFRHWADRSGRLATVVQGESLDDGLGELPHYSQWKDPTGRDPMGVAGIRVLSASR